MRTKTARFAYCPRRFGVVEKTSHVPFLCGSRRNETADRPQSRIRGRGIRPGAVVPQVTRSFGARGSCRWLLRFAFAWLVGLAVVAASLPIHAQTAHSGATITVLNFGGAGPIGIAVDGSGNVFVAQNNGAVTEVAAVNGIVSQSSTQLNVGNGFVDPNGVAVDRNGNVFVADTDNSAVKEIVAVNGVVTADSTVITLGGGFNLPSGVAIDSSGDVFVADDGSNTVKEIVAVNGVVSSSSTVLTLASGFNQSFSVAVDGGGNVFVADNGNSAIKEIVAVNGVVSSSSVVNTVGSGISYPLGVTVDASGNVYATDGGSQAVKEIVAVSGVVSSSSTVNTLSSGYSDLTGLAVDGRGNVFVVDNGNGAIREVVAGAQKFPATAVGSASAPLTTYFTFTSSGTLALTPYVVLTQGAQGKDFQASASQLSNACVAGQTYNAGDVCTVNVTFNPTRPFQRLGAVQLMGAAGTPIATSNLSGAGTGPMVTFPSNSAVTTLAGNGAGGIRGVAVDGSGNIFFADTNNHVVKEIAAATGNVTTVGSGFSDPSGVAVDGSGNVFVADYGAYAVFEITAINGVVSSGSNVNRVGSGFNTCFGVAVDGSGNVFVADTDNNAVKQIVAVNGVVTSQSTIDTLGSGFQHPVSVAVDASGNVFVADTSDSAVKEIVAVNGVASPQSAVNTVGSGFTNPFGVAVDGLGDVFVADAANSAVLEIVAVNGVVSSTSTVNRMASGFIEPLGIAVDGSGNVFVGDGGAVAVYEIDRSDPPTLTFAATTVGQTSTDSPMSLQVENSGNQPLSAMPPGILVGTNFAQVFGNGTYPDCIAGSPVVILGAPNTGFNLDPGAECDLSISFTPQSVGPIQNAAILFDNALNVSNSQLIPLVGTGTAAVPTITFSVPDQTYGVAPFKVSATSNSTGAFTYSVVNGPASISGNTVTITGTGPVTLQASQAASGNYTAGSQLATFTVAQAMPNITFSVPNQSYGVTPFKVSATSNSTGAITYSVVSGQATISGNVVTISGAGSVTLTATEVADSNYAAGSANTTFTVAQAGSTIKLAAMLNSSGNTATLTATVGSASSLAAGDAGPTGMVTFSNASGLIGTVTLVDGVATLTTPAYTGSQNFTATYKSDGNFTTSESNTVALSFTVNPTTTFSYSPAAPYVYGENFTIAAKSSSTGTITYKVLSGPAMVSGSTITITGKGTISIQATQAAAPGYNASTQTLPSLTAGQASSTTSLTATAVKSGSGSAATLTATVAPQYTGIPTGSVTFYDGQTKLATVALSGGKATYTTPQLVGTSHSFMATYMGDSNFAGSSSNTVTLTAPETMVSLQLLSTRLVYPEPPAFAIKVGTGASPAPTGTVKIYDGTTVVGTYTLYAQFKGNLFGLLLPPLSVGTHMLEAVYSGDANYAPGQSAIVTVTVTPGPVKLSLSCANTKLKLGQTLTCIVDANEGPLPVPGTVNYTVTGWGTGSVTLNKAGQATISYLEPNRGTFTLSATYAAQGNYQAAPPAKVTFTVN